MLVSCDESRNKATLGGTRDTTSVNKAGGPPISDTAAISRNRRDSAGRKNNLANGNADPSGRI
ncbi:hypothetical protein [Mucilaginibacter flavus]|uniref:hypothetical protein n=1 Tax=Mucilaginibacter flavus TaxID=931504 RepID=UPI0025B4EA62|nr:hypothetical protein [Mucilaginibacter flavus]MDN3583456.1 hypothetical protein [Mucilaginibacter flavus]